MKLKLTRRRVVRIAVPTLLLALAAGYSQYGTGLTDHLNRQPPVPSVFTGN
ncbi:hypothetical protein [Kribbella hippodromi]